MEYPTVAVVMLKHLTTVVTAVAQVIAMAVDTYCSRVAALMMILDSRSMNDVCKYEEAGSPTQEDSIFLTRALINCFHVKSSALSLCHHILLFLPAKSTLFHRVFFFFLKFFLDKNFPPCDITNPEVLLQTNLLLQVRLSSCKYVFSQDVNYFLNF